MDVYELRNKASGLKITITEKDLDILRAKNWLSRYDAPVKISGGNPDSFVPAEVKDRLKTRPSTNKAEAVPVSANQQEIPDLPAKDKKD